MNEVFAAALPNDPPARTTAQAAMAEPEMLGDIEAIDLSAGLERWNPRIALRHSGKCARKVTRAFRPSLDKA
jgi:hypothetical protein